MLFSMVYSGRFGGKYYLCSEKRAGSLSPSPACSPSEMCQWPLLGLLFYMLRDHRSRISESGGYVFFACVATE